MKEKSKLITNIKTKPMEEVRIGDQIWMTQNLNVDKFRNGDPIPEAKTPEEWEKASKNRDPAWCYLDNDPANGEKYGKLYNWYAVDDRRGLAPEGWYIPLDDEWTTLVDYLGGEDEAGVKMKSANGWDDGGNGTNESGFSGLPGGIMGFESSNGWWWSCTKYEHDIDYARCHFLLKDGGIIRDIQDKGEGLSVRCLRN
jgi:uncharacterized protein (TIGR02145 family)